MPRSGSTHHRGYGWAYRLARSAILGPSGNGLLPADPPCSIRGPRCTGIATTADHDPPLEVAGYHLHLVPACGPCNFGKRPDRRPSAPPSRAW